MALPQPRPAQPGSPESLPAFPEWAQTQVERVLRTLEGQGPSSDTRIRRRSRATVTELRRELPAEPDADEVARAAEVLAKFYRNAPVAGAVDPEALIDEVDTNAAELEAPLHADADVNRDRINDLTGDVLIAGAAAHLDASVVTKNVASRAREELKEFGIDLLDVRIKRTDLPEENQKAIFSRMRSEREQEAKQYRAEGKEKAEEIRAKAEKERAVMLSEARREAAVTRGEGDAEATRIYSRAHGNAAEFYGFTRSLRTYRESLGNNTRILLTPDSELLRYLPAMDGGEED